MMRYVTPGWSLRDMGQAFDLLRQRVQALDPPVRDPQTGGFCCVSCGAAMLYPTIVIADAGQAYEDLDSHENEKVTDQLFDEIPRHTRSRTLTITDKKRGFETRWGGNYAVPHADRCIFSFKSLRRCRLGFLGMRLYRIGDFAWIRSKVSQVAAPCRGAFLRSS